MQLTRCTAASELAREVAHLHQAIAARVAAALEAGGPTWDVTAPLVRDLLGDAWSGAPPVVLARALARQQCDRSALLSEALERGDGAAAEVLVAGLRRSSRRLAAVLGGASGAYPGKPES